jgi:hypothetical protein
MTMRIITVSLYFIYLFSFLIVFLNNPGIPGREHYRSTFRFEKEEDKKNYQRCLKCNIIIPKSFKIIHCKKCGICIIKQDHHCPWTGKCIAKKNIIFFLIFTISLFGYIVFAVVDIMTFFIYINIVKSK